MFTVIHFNRITGKWHVETEGRKGEETLWTADQGTATSLAEGYTRNKFQARVLPAEGVTVILDKFMAPYVEYAGS